MATSDASELYMKFVLNGTAIDGEAQTNLLASTGAVNRKMLTGFEAGSFFEVDRFSFKVGTSGTEPGGAEETVVDPKTGQVKVKSGNYKSWRAGRNLTYPLDVQPVSFTRPIDKASVTLIQNCIDSVSYDSATLIKRKATGGPASGEVFLRMDFIGVLVTDVDWDNEHEISETCKFVCRSVNVRYRPQNFDGTLGASVLGFWTMVAGATPLVL